MPTYPTIETFKGYFYNNKNVNGVDDRVYTAKDMRKPYDAVFTDGVKPEADGTAGGVLKVTASGGMSISIAEGYAKLGGAPVENTAPYNIILDGAISSVRYDAVIIRNDDTEDVRKPSIYVKSFASIPTVDDLERNANAYELCLAYVVVPAFATSISDTDIVDTREDGSLCSVMSGVGATVIRTYRNTYFSETVGQAVIPIGITKYDRTRDNLTVIIEGRVFTEGTNYTITSNTEITLAIGLPVVGTKIEFEVAKNVNAHGAETVIQEVGELLQDVAAINKMLEHHYYCNGLTDNVEISRIAQAFVNGGTDYRGMRLVVHGTFGATLPYSGSGTSASNYFWFTLGSAGARVNRKLIVDFTDCTAITLPIEAGTYNTIFAGDDVHVIGASVIASQSGANTYIRGFSSANGVVVAEDCRFWITATLTSYISQTGTFIRCRGSVTVAGAAGYCFYATASALIRVYGGEYYAYSSNGVSSVLYQTAASAVAIMYGVNCPTNARPGYTQNYAVNVSGANVSITDTITALPINIPYGNVRGTLAISKPGMM